MGSNYVIGFPQPKCRLLINNGDLQIDIMHDCPNIWWRFWLWVLLGWTYKRIQRKSNG